MEYIPLFLDLTLQSTLDTYIVVSGGLWNFYTANVYGGLRGICRFSLQYYLWKKGCKNHKETLYSSEGKIMYVVGKPCNIYRLRGNPIL